MPGPDAFNPDPNATMKSAAKWGFGSEKRKELGKGSISPGPGIYEIKPAAFNSDKPRFHMGIKVKDL
jgi:hypothetical protein